MSSRTEHRRGDRSIAGYALVTVVLAVALRGVLEEAPRVASRFTDGAMAEALDGALGGPAASRARWERELERDAEALAWIRDNVELEAYVVVRAEAGADDKRVRFVALRAATPLYPRRFFTYPTFLVGVREGLVPFDSKVLFLDYLGEPPPVPPAHPGEWERVAGGEGWTLWRWRDRP